MWLIGALKYPSDLRTVGCCTDFLQVARECWSQIDVEGFDGYRLCKKLQILKSRVKIWYREVFGKLDKERDILIKRVEEWDKEGDQRILSQQEIVARNEEVGKIWFINHMEEVAWRQKSRIIWLKEDKNTRFFHKMANARQRINHINRIKREGRIFEGPSTLKQ